MLCFPSTASKAAPANDVCNQAAIVGKPGLASRPPPPFAPTPVPHRQASWIASSQAGTTRQSSSQRYLKLPRSWCPRCGQPSAR
eukprot:365854-Chlamydomonas_euryale.AAC.6